MPTQRDTMKLWFTADLHLGHGNIIKFCNRPFMTAKEQAELRGNPRAKLRLSDETIRRHDDALIDTINACVGADDVLWILGDFCWGQLHEATEYRKRIRCRNVHLVWGNHDHRSVRGVFGEAIEQRMITCQG